MNPRAPPCQGYKNNELIANYQLSSNDNFHPMESTGGARGFKSPPAHSTPIDWQSFHNFLLQRMTAKTAEDRMQYAKRYVDILANNGNACNQLLSAPPNKRIHIMKALSSVARFTGRSEQWRQMRQQYQLSWSTGTEKIDAFTRFFDSSKDLDTMLQWLREAVNALPPNMPICYYSAH